MSVKATPRGDLPSGTVTMLFADVEGSTRLLHSLGDRYLPVRTRSRELVRAAASAHHGHEVDWAGDGVFLAFERAGDAVAAAADVQLALAREPWAPDEGIRLRVGIHTGEPDLDAEGYVGIDVVVAARICSAAHGGQVVASSATQRLAGTAPAEVSFRPLGPFRLKDIREPHELFQLVGPGLADGFPPLATLGGGALPTLHHRLVGRVAQLAEIQALLARPDVRLVTITGAGGAGKSRLALEIASQQAAQRPVQLVGLASISDAELVPAAIGRALGVKESPSEPLLEDIAGVLRGTHALLYLDNLEHLPAASGHVRALLDAAPDLVVLATSRAPLRLSGERVLALDPLPPDEAVELFVELTEARGLRVPEPTLPTIRAICERVDFLPLAIELVAARLAVLSAGQLLDALGSGLALDLEGSVDLPERQRTLRATLDWGYELLTPTQRSLHGALAVFAGGCTLEDARVVSGEPGRFLSDLETLVLGSLVRGDAGGGETRLTLLETIREHALDRLEAAGELDDLRSRHARRFAELALDGSQGLESPEHAAWAERLELELDNIRAALEWMLASGDTEAALRTSSSLERFWRAHGHVTEARQWLARGLRQADGVPAEVRAAALWTAAQQAAAQSDWEVASPMLQEARELYRICGDGRAEVFALANASFVALRQNDAEHAERLALEAVEVAEQLDDDRAASAAAMVLADIHSAQGAHTRALEGYERAVVLRSQLGDPFLVCDAVYNLGLAAFHADDPPRARSAFEDALRRARELDEAPYVAAAQLMLALLDTLSGDAAGASGRAQEALDLYTALDDDRSRARCLVPLAASLAEDGRLEDAARMLGAAAALRDGEADEFEEPILGYLEPRLSDSLGAERFHQLAVEGAVDVEDALLVTDRTPE